jgi:hypothetical protein
MALAFWYIHTRIGRRAMVITHNEKTTQQLFNKAEIFHTNLPELFKPILESNNKRELVFGTKNKNTAEAGLMSAVATATAGDKGSGHGQTIHCLIASELSRWQSSNLEQVMSGLTNAVPSGMDATGSIYIIETVANYAGDYFHNRYMSAVDGRSRFEPIFLPWYLHHEYREPVIKSLHISEELREMQKRFYLDDEQITWYHYKLLETEDDHPGRGEQMMRALYPATEDEAFIGSGGLVFPDEALMAVQQQVHDPIRTMNVDSNGFTPNDRGPFRIYKEPEKGRKYAIGADVGLGVGRTDSVIEVLGYPGYEQVAEYSSNTIDPKDFAYQISQVGQYYNDALVAVEINNAGVLTNTELQEVYPSGNLYTWEYFNRTQQTKIQKLGWQTSYETKELLVGHARSIMKRDDLGAVIPSALLLSQLRTFIDQGGVYGAMPNCKDDLVMAWLIALMAMWRKIARFESLMNYQIGGKKPKRDKPDFYYNDWDPSKAPESKMDWMGY